MAFIREIDADEGVGLEERTVDENTVQAEEDINNEGDSKQVYEISFHISPVLIPEDLQKEFEDIKRVLSEKAAVISESFPVDIKLSYPISIAVENKKTFFDSAFFGWVKFEVSIDGISELKELFDGRVNILRFLIIKTVKENTMPESKSSEDSLQNDTEDSSQSDEKSNSQKEVAEKDSTKDDKEEVSSKDIDESIDKLIVE